MAKTTYTKISLEVFLEKEQFEEVFENAEVKMTGAKLKKFKELMEEFDIDIKEQLEIRLMEYLEELIVDEFGDE